MPSKLCDFAVEIRKSIDEFESAYAAKAAENPETYLTELPDNNSGLWFEFFMDFYLTGNV
jgi:hypothetical protein